MKSKKVTKKEDIYFSSSNIYLLHFAFFLLSIVFLKLFKVTKYDLFLELSLYLLVGTLLSLIFFSYFSIKKYWIDKSNPLFIFKKRRFETWLINAKFCNFIDDKIVEIPKIVISMNKNDYFLDIQELYLIGNKLLESSSAINSYAQQENCKLILIECYRYNGAIRYHFIKHF